MKRVYRIRLPSFCWTFSYRNRRLWRRQSNARSAFDNFLYWFHFFLSKNIKIFILNKITDWYKIYFFFFLLFTMHIDCCVCHCFILLHFRFHVLRAIKSLCYMDKKFLPNSICLCTYIYSLPTTFSRLIRFHNLVYMLCQTRPLPAPSCATVETYRYACRREFGPDRVAAIRSKFRGLNTNRSRLQFPSL